MAGAYRINSPKVTSQVTDGEAVLIHFDSGRYYSADGSGGEILDALARGQPVSEIVDALAARHGGRRETIAPTVQGFVDELVAEELIVPADAPGGPDADGAAADAAVSFASTPSATFEAPHLRIYSELADLLRLDPIHDVDAAGWPVAKS
jgi:hypothetical protein